MTSLAPLTMPVTRLGSLEEPWRGPLMVVRLVDGCDATNVRLPPCPTIGVGSPDHPIADCLDAVVGSPAELQTLAGPVTAHPLAAAALVRMLRVTAGLSCEDALAVESMAYGMLQGSGEHAAWRAGQHARSAVQPGRVEIVRIGDRLDVTLDRPDAGNAIDRPMRDGLHEALSLAAADPDLKIRLKGRGKAFSLGADLAEFGTTTDPATAHAIRALTLPAHVAIRCADRMEVHVDGACVGAGLELAAFAGRVTATPRSWFQLPELAMGIIPGAGGCVSVPRRIGRQRTAWLVLSGRRIGAQQALAWGLIDAIVDQPSGDQGGGDVI